MRIDEGVTFIRGTKEEILLKLDKLQSEIVAIKEPPQTSKEEAP